MAEDNTSNSTSTVLVSWGTNGMVTFDSVRDLNRLTLFDLEPSVAEALADKLDNDFTTLK